MVARIQNGDRNTARMTRTTGMRSKDETNAPLLFNGISLIAPPAFFEEP